MINLKQVYNFHANWGGMGVTEFTFDIDAEKLNNINDKYPSLQFYVPCLKLGVRIGRAKILKIENIEESSRKKVNLLCGSGLALNSPIIDESIYQDGIDST